MSDTKKDKQNQEQISLDFSFAPDWARTSSDDYTERYHNASYDRQDRAERKPRFSNNNGGGDFNRRRNDFDEGGRSRRDRPPRDRFERNDHQARKGGRINAENKGTNQALPENTTTEQTQTAENRQPRTRRPYQQREYIQPLNAEIRILPGQKTLGMIMKRIQSSHVAYPVKSFVNLFLDNPGACLVRLESKKDDPVTFFQCKQCGFVALSEAEVTAHIFAEHIADFYEISDVECQPPSGNFAFVTKCGFSGEFIGAPNHHSYKRRVAEMAARFNVSEDAYLARTQTVRDPEAIEEWKKTLCHTKQYVLKIAEPTKKTEPTENAEDSAVAETVALTQDAAEYQFKCDILPKLITSASHVCCSVSIAETTSSASIKFLLRQTLRDEQRYPRSLFYALRGAFRHRKFFVFRVNEPRGAEFVMSNPPSALDLDHAVAELKNAVQFVTENPLCTKHELMTAITKDLPETEVVKIAGQVAWLFSKVHLIEYYNGTLAIPAEFPMFKRLPSETKHLNKPETESTEETQAATEAKTSTAEETPAEDVAPAATSTETPVVAESTVTENTETVSTPTEE